MVAKIAALEQVIAKRRPDAEALEEKASDIEDKAFKGTRTYRSFTLSYWRM